MSRGLGWVVWGVGAMRWGTNGMGGAWVLIWWPMRGGAMMCTRYNYICFILSKIQLFRYAAAKLIVDVTSWSRLKYFHRLWPPVITRLRLKICKHFESYAWYATVSWECAVSSIFTWVQFGPLGIIVAFICLCVRPSTSLSARWLITCSS